MPRLAPKPLSLEPEEREQLQQLSNRHSTPQQIALRAKIILLADAGHNHRELGRQLNISWHTTARSVSGRIGSWQTNSSSKRLSKRSLRGMWDDY